ncbi:MAG: alpha/beta hydrolase [Marinobacter sp.]|nr:alpha/beta hydrolase [Marinobacter sp.]
MDEAKASSAMAGQQPLDVSWDLGHVELAGLHWPATGDGRCDAVNPLIGLHGWLDNAATFYQIGHGLSRWGPFYAVDMAGHGLSSHRPPGQGYLLVDYVADLACLLAQHFPHQKVRLVGHSLGGIVALYYAAAFPENVEKLVLIDSLGPITKPPGESVSQLRSGIEKRLTGSAPAPVYPSVEAAAKTRAGGLSPLSEQAAGVLVPRNLKPLGKGFSWRTDPRLRHPSMIMYEESQVRDCLQKLQADALLLVAEQGLLKGHPLWSDRLALATSMRQIQVPGGHHCHLDGDTAPLLAAIDEFLSPPPSIE